MLNWVTCLTYTVNMMSRKNVSYSESLRVHVGVTTRGGEKFSPISLVKELDLLIKDSLPRAIGA